MSVSGGPSIVEDGLLFAVDAANVKSYSGSGATWFDLNGQGTNVSLTNAPTFVTGSTVISYFDFNGTSNYIQLPTTASAASGKNEVTLTYVIQPDSLTSNRTLWEESSGTGRWQFSMTLAGFYTRDTSTGTLGTRNNDLTMPTLNTTGWHVLTFTYSVANTSKRIYYNGELFASSSTSIETLTEPRDFPPRFGFPGDGTYFDGKLALVHFYNKALTPQEVLQNFNALRGRFGI